MKVPVMSSNAAGAPEAPLQIPTFDGPLGRRIIETHIWAVREGLNGDSAHDLFDGYCQRLVIHGVPLWRGYATMQTLHPQMPGRMTRCLHVAGGEIDLGSPNLSQRSVAKP